MKRDIREILIQSIMGGHAEFENFAQADQFLDSYGIDPEQDTLGASSKRSSGYLRPTAMTVGASGTTAGFPMWFIPNPKDSNIYVYDSVGSVHTKSIGGATLTGLSDLNDGASASGNGACYYDNYIYFARNTDIARYGPLNGSPSFTDSYWVGTLGKTALTHTSYPNASSGPVFPNHPMKVINGKLLIGDVVGNQGVIHYIKTKKVTVEGDTDDGSTFNAIDFPYGYWPTCIEKYGEGAAISLYEGTQAVTRKTRAAVIFWDTVNQQNYDRTIKDEFPDPFIGALYNANGILYTFSGEASDSTVRIMRLTGGYSFEQVQYIQQASVPLPGGVDGLLNKIFFGSNTGTAGLITDGPRVFSVGMENRPLGNQIFAPFALQGSESALMISALKFTSPGGVPDIGFQYNCGYPTTTYVPAKWRSQTYRIGKRFQPLKIRIPLAQAMASNMSLAVKLYADEDKTTPIYTNLNITSAAYPNGERNIVLRLDGITGWHSLNLDLEWLGGTSTLLTVALPISIEYEVFDD